MLIPSKHELLDDNQLIVGAAIIKILKIEQELNIEDLFELLKRNRNLNLNQFFYCLTFLWLSEVILLESHMISLNLTK
jgi:hypothetical protein